MKNKTFLILCLGLGFVGFTSCGEDKNDARDIQMEALMRLNRSGGSGGTSSVTVTVTQSNTNTVTATSTVTATTTTTATSSIRE